MFYSLKGFRAEEACVQFTSEAADGYGRIVVSAPRQRQLRIDLGAPVDMSDFRIAWFNIC